jgi:LAS superfamily LD-carboxypeptidase LdcB
MGTESERCFLLFVSFDLLLHGGNTGGLKEENKGGEERRKEGNPARWPLSKTGLLADMSRYRPQIQKKNGGTDPTTEDKWGKPM